MYRIVVFTFMEIFKQSSKFKNDGIKHLPKLWRPFSQNFKITDKIPIYFFIYGPILIIQKPSESSHQDGSYYQNRFCLKCIQNFILPRNWSKKSEVHLQQYKNKTRKDIKKNLC